MFSSLRNFHPLGVAASAGLKGALPKVLLGAALLGGGGSVLSAGSAQAQVAPENPCADGSCTFDEWVTNPLIADDKIFTYVPGTSVNVPIAGTTVSAIPFGGDVNYLFNMDFASFVTTPFTLHYTASINSAGLAAGKFFSAVDLDSDVDAFPGGCPSMSPFPVGCEELTATFTNVPPPGLVILKSINGSSSVANVSGHPTVLDVSNVFTPNGGSIDAFVNSYQQGTKVPGPLPLLGAGMAFGFSRKLRSRIKARVQA